MIQKYKKITITVLVFILVLISLFFIDRWILPQKTIDDKIISFSTIRVTNSSKFMRSQIVIGHTFFTQNGFCFSTENAFVEEDEVTIKYTSIFKNITGVKTRIKDYSDKLISDFNGACYYFIIVLVVSAIISLLILRLNISITENGFQNIILFNSLMLFYLCYLFLVHN